MRVNFFNTRAEGGGGGVQAQNSLRGNSQTNVVDKISGPSQGENIYTVCKICPPPITIITDVHVQ